VVKRAVPIPLSAAPPFPEIVHSSPNPLQNGLLYTDIDLKSCTFSQKIMEAAQLCEHCRQIRFDNLRYPTASEMANLQRGGAAREMLFVKYFDPKVIDKKTNLGKPSRIRQDSPHCRLCHLIWQTLIRYNGPKVLDFTPDGEEITCHADTTYYGLFWRPREEGKYHTVNRLSIITKVADRPTDTSIQFAFQTCNPGALSVQIDDNFQDPRADVDRLFFGGRKRPLDINLQWLRRWIKICQEEHGRKCEIKQSQAELR
jgi:hypothetical protein